MRELKMWTDEENNLLEELAKQGLTTKKIAQKLGRSYSSVYSHLEYLRIKHQGKNKIGKMVTECYKKHNYNATPHEVAEETGLTYKQVRTAYYRNSLFSTLKKERIIRILEKGETHSTRFIAEACNCTYDYAWKVRKQWNNEKHN